MISNNFFYMIPLKDMIVFPKSVAPLFIGRKKSIKAIEKCSQDKSNKDKTILLVTQKKASIENPSIHDLYEVGIVAIIKQALKLPDGTIKILVEGKHRVKINHPEDHDDYMMAQASYIYDKVTDKLEMNVYKKEILKHLEIYAKLDNKFSMDNLVKISNIYNTAEMIDNIAMMVNVSIKEKQKILENENVIERFDILKKYLVYQINIAELEKKIKSKVKNQIEKNQKEYYLNEQLKATQDELKELTGKDNIHDDCNAIEKKINIMKIPKKNKEKLLEEVKKLKFMNPMSSESGVIRTYIEWVMSLPFGKHKKLNFDLKKAIQTLDDKHYGLEEIKDVILETIAVQKRVGISKKSILCFVGPPGVGKTSLGKSIATAMGRPFARIALGGLKDESEIRGHRRTYIGAMPGKIIQTMKKVKYSNPVILLDEIDKMSQDWRGDPASAMLEVLDPEQNKFFTDHYMEIEYDLSNVMFIATANSLDIPLPLADRMEIIHISGYTENEKLEIAQNYLTPDLMRDHGLEKSEISFSKNVLKHIIDYYTRESGVRELYRQILKICRKAVLKLSEKGTKAVDLDIKHIQQYLGIKKFKHNEKMQNNTIGVATGLAWTSVGGDILYIESVLTQGKGDIHITGKLGDVMQESAKAAFSYVKAHCKELGIDEDILKKNDIHVHVPEGAVSKNGPSAGITICTSIVSLLTNRPIKSNIAMTGEVTLVGNVLPIGGLKEKLIAADRSGITDILIPYENEKDLVKVPKEIKDKLNIKLVKKVDEVFKSAIENEVRH